MSLKMPLKLFGVKENVGTHTLRKNLGDIMLGKMDLARL